jgi:hypothetical protein
MELDDLVDDAGMIMAAQYVTNNGDTESSDSGGDENLVGPFLEGMIIIIVVAYAIGWYVQTFLVQT